MEQSNRKRAHIERILLVCGPQNAGKSRLLRHMLTDARLGGVLPAQGPAGLRALSRERCLSVRISSPHEMKDTPQQFYDKIDSASGTAWNKGFWRFNFACAVQPFAANNMPDLTDVCRDLMRLFWPERVRVVQLDPQQSNVTGSSLSQPDVDRLRGHDIEVITVDARRSAHAAEPGNIRILADFFDFT